ncbi:MAG: gliding motility lipoprotein GldH [Chitinophagaceae bacterium]|nr:MAG: gliding motility lipoprotein GldH [Chitinophagaceae bacterium]
MRGADEGRAGEGEGAGAQCSVDFRCRIFDFRFYCIMTRVFAFAFLLFLFAGCDTIDLYEQTASIKDHSWRSSQKPVFRFAIKDTTSAYNLFVLLRHSARYHYNNIWINLSTTGPDGKTGRVQYELPLADPEKGWLGSGMDDIYEHRIALTPLEQTFRFQKAGTYTFTIEHLMREDPLREVYNVGLRVEKKQR